MGSPCFSSASILRCESFTRIQNILLIVPTALEVIFSTSLIFTNWGTGRRHLWLTAEGWVYLALALIEMLSHILPAVRDGAEVYRIFDISLAAASFFPILCYTIFIFLFSRSELIGTLPAKFQTTSKLMLLIFIPAIVAVNEVASFVGISHRIVRRGTMDVLDIGFKSDKDRNLWTFFTSLTLALLIAYQALNFMLAFCRLVRTLLDQRRIETTNSDEIHLVNGIGWISAALKLGAIETLVGFADGGFGGALTRRILRLLARAFMCIGVVKGTDFVEDFRQVRDEMTGNKRPDFRRSRLREFISNPRLSTFRQLTPTATAFHSIPRAPNGLSQFSPRGSTTGGLSGMKEFATMKQFAGAGNSIREPVHRVTVHFDKGPPTLHVRFSTLEFPSPIFNARSRPHSEWVPVSRPVSYRHTSYQARPPPSPSLLSSLDLTDHGPKLISPPRLNDPPPTKPRAISSYTVPKPYTSPLGVRELTAQFPNPPSRALGTLEHSSAEDIRSDFWDLESPTQEDGSSNLSHASSMSRRKPVPIPRPDSPNITPTNPYGSNEELPTLVPLLIPLGQPVRTLRNPSAQFNQDVSVPSSPTPTPMTTLSGYTQTPTETAVLTPDTDDGFLDLGTVLDKGKSRELMMDYSGETHPANWIDYSVNRPIDRLPLMAIIEGGAAQNPSGGIFQRESTDGPDGSEEMDTLAIPWLKDPAMEERERRLARTMKKKTQLSRIKSVGKAPRRVTPAPIRTGHTRGSLHIEPIMIPPKQSGMTEVIQGSLDSTYSSSILRDSEVLGLEDRNYTRGARPGVYF